MFENFISLDGDRTLFISDIAQLEFDFEREGCAVSLIIPNRVVEL